MDIIGEDVFLFFFGFSLVEFDLSILHVKLKLPQMGYGIY